MSQTLVIQESFYNSVVKNIDVVISKNYDTVDLFFSAIIKRLNDEFSYLEIDNYRFSLPEERKNLSQYGAFIEGDDLPYKRLLCFSLRFYLSKEML